MKSLQEWKNKVWNTKIDLDNQSYDCVDVSKSWVEYLTDKPWLQSAGWGNAKDIYYNWSQTYLERIPRGNAPKLGDILVMNGNIGGGYGHTGVVVGIDGGNITIYQQDTFKQVPVYTGVFAWNSNMVTGFLRPKVAFTEGNAPLEAYQRLTVPEGVYYRTEPKAGAPLMSPDFFDGGEVVNFKGYVRGGSVDGNNIWFVGRFSGGYSHSSGYTDSSTNGLPDLTPVVVAPPALAANQRQVATDAMNVRKAPALAPDNVVKLLQPSEVITLKGYVKGQKVDGHDTWFVLEDGTYTWAAGYTNMTTSGLSDLTPPTTPVEPTTPTAPTEPTQPTNPAYPAPTTDAAVTAVFNKKHPLPAGYAPTDLVKVGTQYLREEAANSLALMQTAGANLTAASGYRSFATQQQLYASYVAQDGQAEADTYSARAGHSEHQTGLTMDFAPIAASFANTAQYQWLVANAHKYGWVLRYPSDKVAITGYMSEPWHWRYVGVTVANDMHTKGIKTLEEYFNIAGGLYADQEPTLPTTPTEPTTPVEPVPSDEASKSAAAFVARITSQLAAAGIIVTGLSAMLVQYVGVTLPANILGGATLAIALALVAYGQYKYKKTGGTKGWFF
jgi:D-alanyl-D-alanine carboxypeptidase